MKLLSKDDITTNSKKINVMSGIYFLIYKKEIVYVGQTTAGYYRIYSHVKTKQFNCFFFHNCKKEKLNELESKYILKFKPKYNLTINNILFISLNNLKNKYKKLNEEINMWKIKKAIIKLKLQTYSMNNNTYILKKNIPALEKYIIEVQK